MVRLFTGTCLTLVSAAIAVTAFAIGCIVGWLSTSQDIPDYYREYTMENKPIDPYSEALFAAGIVGEYDGDNEAAAIKREREWNKRESERDLSDESIVYNYVRRRLDVAQLRTQIGILAERPRMAGSEHDTRMARMIEKKFMDYGLDFVRTLSYRVLLSRPSTEIPNRVYLLDSQDGDRILLESSHRETATELDPEHNVPPAFSAYSPAGDITATYVYVNYGRLIDFDALATAGIDVAGRITVMRYGKIFAGEKVRLAQLRGAVGAVLYADPAEVAYFGTLPGYVYPNSAWLPGDGIRRERVNTGIGDLATPTWASTEFAYHQFANISVPITIPVQPIKYSDAVQLMTVLEAPATPVNTTAWTGRLPGVPVYHIGPNERYRIRILTNNQLVEAICLNVVGYMYGKYEPQRYVILGSHRDSFTRGVTDSASGTAVMLELARILAGSRRERDWQPRRTLMFASWTAHDYGSIGAFEYAQQFTTELRHRTVAYINSDMCAAGCRPQVRASPLLGSLVRNVLQRIDDPSHPRRSLFERMLLPNEPSTAGGGFSQRGTGGRGGFGRPGIYDNGYSAAGADFGGGGDYGRRNDLFYNTTYGGAPGGGGYGFDGYGGRGGGGFNEPPRGVNDFDVIDRGSAGRPRGSSGANPVIDEFGFYNPQQELPASRPRTPGFDQDYSYNTYGSGVRGSNRFGAGSAARTDHSSVYSRIPYSASHRLRIDYPNGGGDYGPFLYYLGIPVVDVQFRFEPDSARFPPMLARPSTANQDQPGGGAAALPATPGVNLDPHHYGQDEPVDRANPYPAHNTAYQTGRMLEQLDPGMHCHIACAKVAADLSVALADSLVLPFNVTDFALQVRRMWDEFSTDRQLDLLEFGGGMYTARLRSRLDEFVYAAIEFQNSIIRAYRERRGGALNPFNTRRMNDQMMMLERAFTLDQSIEPGNFPQYRHLVASPSTIDNSRGHGFPGIRDRLTLLRQTAMTDESRIALRRELEIQLTQLTLAVEAAIEILHPQILKEKIDPMTY